MTPKIKGEQKEYAAKPRGGPAGKNRQRRMTRQSMEMQE